MARLFSFLFALIGGIVLVVLVGSVFLPVIAGILIAWALLVFFAPGRRVTSADKERFSEPEDDVPASQAVIDVQAVEVNEEGKSDARDR